MAEEQTGIGALRWTMRSVGAAEWLLASLGVPDTASPAEQLAALQAASVEELLELQPGLVQRLTESFNTTARPCVDGVVMPLWPTAVREQAGKKIPWAAPGASGAVSPS